MAVSIVLATGFLRGVPRSSSQQINSVSMNRHSLRFPSPNGWAGTCPSRAHLTSVRLSIHQHLRGLIGIQEVFTVLVLGFFNLRALGLFEPRAVLLPLKSLS